MMRTGKWLYAGTGIGMILVFWWINWSGTQLRTHWAFFPLWLGYMITVDAIAVFRGRSPLLLRRWETTAGLFLLSIPLWWLFEWLNKRAEYWVYLPEDAFSPLAHTLWSTLCFSTVVPAIFVTAHVLLSFQFFKTHHIRWIAAKSRRSRIHYLVCGMGMLLALLLWPQYGMAFMWISLFCILSPVNVWLGRPSLMHWTSAGDWRLVLVFFASALICGVFWEFWNWKSWPKWVYTFPYLDGLKVFEMPLAGYLGYLPFGLEVWAIAACVMPGVCREMAAALESEGDHRA